MNEYQGKALLSDPMLNKSTAFTREEREKYGLRGLLPYGVSDIEMQKHRVLANMRRKSDDIEKYIFLNALQERNNRLFHRTVIDHIEELLPIIYTPTVGEACRRFAHIFRQSRGLYITPEDRGEICQVLDNWNGEEVKVIIVTDGERILGLGDLGANGMGIPIGKATLYAACGGIYPEHCLPVMLDVGTDTDELRIDSLYLGWPHRRLRGESYLALVDELVEALQQKFPLALIQFEDFAGRNAFTLLRRYRDRARFFNDDIQGTAAVALAGVYAACRITGKSFNDVKILFLGAGGAAAGIATLMASAFMSNGLSREQALRRLWLVDINGLVTTQRDALDEWLAPFAQSEEPLDLLQAVRALQPDAIIGATGVAGAFSEDVVRQMAAITERPIIFALSNPTSQSECTAEQAYDWSSGQAIFASGSPFGPVRVGSKTLFPGQANNAYIFPGIGLGVSVSAARRVPDSMFLAAARALADCVSDDQLESGTLFPPLTEIRTVSTAIASAVYNVAIAEGLAEASVNGDITKLISQAMYDPRY